MMTRSVTARFRINQIKQISVTLVILLLSLLTTVAAFIQNKSGAEVKKENLTEKASNTLPKKAKLSTPNLSAPNKNQQVISNPVTSGFTPQNTNNYIFSTATNASLTDMSSGTTQLIGPDQDDAASAITNIGFDFFFQGAR